MRISIPQLRADSVLEELSQQLGVAAVEDCKRSSIKLPQERGVGELISYTLSEGVDALIIAATLRHDWTFTFSAQTKTPVNFLTVADGEFSCAYPPLTDRVRLEPLQSAILVLPNTVEQTWTLPAEEDILVLVIFIHKQLFFQDIDCDTLEVPPGLLDVLVDLQGKSSFKHHDIFHLPIVTALREIVEQESVGLLNSTFATSKLYEILFLQLQQYQLYEQIKDASVIQSEKGLELVRQAENVLMSRIQSPPTIPELAKMVGINQQDLKKGFKQLYGQTINQYLNEKRLEQAEFLIKNGELKLQDIADELGYSNPGHFSRRFKDKFGVSPKYFAQQVEKNS